MNMRSYDTMKSPWGEILLAASDRGLSGIYFKRQKYHPRLGADWKLDRKHPVLKTAKRQLKEYFAGKRQEFDLTLDPSGTSYQRAVWKAIARVPYGKTISYGELAKRSGHPDAPRAAGAATGRNPIGIVVPCHRIVGANGSLTGYAGGLDRKRALLTLEGGGR
jgi:methylated-DNA-[protein]-cysteine S-methyltransferase